MALLLLGTHDLGADQSVFAGAVLPKGATMLAKVLADARRVDLVGAYEIPALPVVALVAFDAAELHMPPK